MGFIDEFVLHIFPGEWATTSPARIKSLNHKSFRIHWMLYKNAPIFIFDFTTREDSAVMGNERRRREGSPTDRTIGLNLTSGTVSATELRRGEIKLVAGVCRLKNRCRCSWALGCGAWHAHTNQARSRYQGFGSVAHVHRHEGGRERERGARGVYMWAKRAKWRLRAGRYERASAASSRRCCHRLLFSSSDRYIYPSARGLSQ